MHSGRPRRRYVAHYYVPYHTDTPPQDEREASFYLQAGLRRTVSLTRAQNEAEMRKNHAETVMRRIRQSQLRKARATPSAPQVNAVTAENVLPRTADCELEVAMFTSMPLDGPSSSTSIPGTNSKDSARLDDLASISPSSLFTDLSVERRDRRDPAMRSDRTNRRTDIFNANIEELAKQCGREDSREIEGGGEGSGQVVVSAPGNL
ncbi:hypothetical protein DL96DRAFT_1622185 [Flagelloscypha sp. PMI_526]|nr:hypothetical protein DL96DRAFT_1622185 [Flagelloscypha sp. PMI_526]